MPEKKHAEPVAEPEVEMDATTDAPADIAVDIEPGDSPEAPGGDVEEVDIAEDIVEDEFTVDADEKKPRGAATVHAADGTVVGYIPPGHGRVLEDGEYVD